MNLHRHRALRLLALGLTLASIAGAQGNIDASQSAKEHFAAGVAHVQDPSGPKYEEAYREFKAAYAENPLHTIALNVGYCAFFLERDQESLEMYELYLSKVGATEIPKAQREQLERDVRALKAGLVRVSVKVAPAKAILVDERIPTKGSVVVNRYPIENGVAQLGMHPGSHRVTLVADGYQSQSWEFEAPPASSHVREFVLVADASKKPTIAGSGSADLAAHTPKEPTSGSTESARGSASESVYLGVAVTGIFVVGTTATGVLALSKKSEFDKLNKDGLRPADAKSARDSAEQYALFTNIGLGAAIISAGVTAFLYLRAPTEKARQDAHRSSWTITPNFGRDEANISLSGGF